MLLRPLRELATRPRRVLILALAPECSESYDNVNAIMTKLCIEGLREAFPKSRISYAVDLKMALVLLGIKSAASRFGCPYCLWSRWKEHCLHEQRTILGLTAEAGALKQRLIDDDGRDARPGECRSSGGEQPMSFIEVETPIV